ncbi:hypothetical protein JKP88DRAFT_250233 [Tribonema minus]|uniref:Uncharacterized protein n=1 Tax=Tribonema minus TaxID=303371 RepID=A0A835YQH1_9STRA|nr:hypothetical protein JKP88DRAFT_250233 [Tribonema minus]
MQPDMCKRPDWRAGGRALSAEALDALETRAFEAWKERLYALYGADALNHFEHNLEVWRQLWRVIERSDVALLLADARCPALHFHESLWRHVTRDLQKACVLCLTKADLVTAAQAAAWVQFFEERYPGLRVVHFASSPKFTRVRGTRVVTADPLGAGSARRVLRAISDCIVTRGGAQVPAAPFVEAALAALPSAADSAQACCGGGGSAAEEDSDKESAQDGSDEVQYAGVAALLSAADSAQACCGGGGSAAEEGSDEESAQEGSDEVRYAGGAGRRLAVASSAMPQTTMLIAQIGSAGAAVSALNSVSTQLIASEDGKRA